jgi:hypothetical protein
MRMIADGRSRSSHHLHCAAKRLSIVLAALPSRPDDALAGQLNLVAQVGASLQGARSRSATRRRSTAVAIVRGLLAAGRATAA